MTHVFTQHPDYLRVFEYLESSSNFFYINCSDLSRLPETGGKEAQKEELRNQIGKAEAVLLISSMYSENRDWITYQMDAAQALDLPIIALVAFGQSSKIPEEIQGRAAEVIEWNERSMVDAIKRQARHEETSRWEVIEFDMS